MNVVRTPSPYISVKLMRRRVFSVFAFIVLNVLAEHAQGQTGTSLAVESKNVQESGRGLREDIVSAYEDLKASGRLRLTGAPNDIGPSVMRYVHPGMPFADAEALLGAAGLSVGARPGPSATGERPDRYDVYSTSSSFFAEKSFGMKQDLVIVISPNSAETYETVKSVVAEIYVRFF